MRNRVTQVTMTPSGGGGIVLATNRHDEYGYSTICGGEIATMASRTLLTLHDDANYGTGNVYRGNVTSGLRRGEASSGVRCFQCNARVGGIILHLKTEYTVNDAGS